MKMQKILYTLQKRADDTQAPYIAFGIFGVINYPLFYFVWGGAIPQEYNSFLLRFIAALLCIPLIFKNYWPERLKIFLPLYWYLTLLYCLPFFGVYMLLKNNFSYGWLINDLLGLFLFVLVIDWFGFIVLTLLGVFLGWLFFRLTSSTPLYLPNDILSLIMTIYPFAIFIGAVFSRRKEKMIEEKYQAIKAVGASIAHELRTPLRTIISSAHGIKKHLPFLLTTYQLSKEAKLAIPYISERRYKALVTACNDIEIEADASFSVINMLLTNLTYSTASFEVKNYSIKNCISDALNRYPFNVDERKWVFTDLKDNFEIKGNKVLMIHVIFNLLKNSIYYIKAANKGDISIRTESGDRYNCLRFKDTGQGIAANVLPYIFNRFYTRTYHGTGIGLAFCKIVMENLGGAIECHSQEGVFTEFILSFPKLELVE